MSSQPDPTTSSPQPPSSPQQSGTVGPLMPAAAIVLVVVGIMAVVAAHAWWATALAIVIEGIALALIVLVMQRVTTTRAGTWDTVLDLANRGEGQNEMSEHDIPMGAPERSAVKRAHEHQRQPMAAGSR